jgi:glycerophosphoryl diester phosphodiesterase
MTNIVSHRGCGYGFVENSLRAVKAALASPCDGVEIDIRLTKDKQFVLCHDTFIDRISKSHGIIGDMTLAQLRTKKLIDNQTFCALEDVLKLVQTYRKPLYIELKDYGQEKKLVALLKKYDCLDYVWILSWNPLILELIKELHPRIKTAFAYVPLPRILSLVRWRRHTHFDGDKVQVNINRFSKLNATEVSLCVYSWLPPVNIDAIMVPAHMMRRSLIRICKKRDIKLINFNVNTKSLFTKLKRLGVDTVIGDRPLALYNQRA